LSSSFLAGAAHCIITPPIGSPLAGFDARKGVAESVHDELHARALAIECGGSTIILLSLEIIAVSRALADTIRRRITESCGVPADNIVVAATHTHCGPVTLNHFFNDRQPLDEMYLYQLVERTVEVATEAHARRQTATIRAGLVPAEGIAVNRRSQDGRPASREAGVVAIYAADGSTLAVLVLFACHPTVLGPNTLAITGDFPYFMGESLRRELGGSVEILFFNGAEGDISVGHRSDASAVGVIAPFRTFAKAQELGGKLGHAVAVGLASLTPQDSRLQIQRMTPRLPLKSYPPVADMSCAREAAFRELQEQPDSLALKQKWLFARIEEYYASLNERQKELPVEVIVIRLGDIALVSIPGEAFHDVGQAIRAQSPFGVTLFLGLANDYIGYIPTAGASADLGYEVVASRVAPEAAAALVDAAVAGLNSLAQSV